MAVRGRDGGSASLPAGGRVGLRAILYRDAASTLRGALVGVVLVVVLVLLMASMDLFYDRPGAAGLVLVIAVLAAASLGRLAAALPTILVACAADAYYFVAPLHEADLGDDVARVSLLTFLLVALAAAATFAYAVESGLRARRAAAALGRLHALTAALAGTTTLGEVVDVVLERGAAALGAPVALLALVDRDEGVLRLVAGRGLTAEQEAAWTAIRLGAANASARALREERVVVVQPGDRRREYPDAAPMLGDDATALIAPLLVEGRAVGTIGFRWPSARPLLSEEITFVESFGEQAAQAIERARLRDAERAARDEAEGLSATLERMQELAPQFGQGGSVEEVEREICVAARESFGGTAAALWQIIDGGMELRHRAPRTPVLASGIRVDFERFPEFAEHLQARAPVFVADIEREYPLLWDLFARTAGVRSQLRLPLTRAGEADALLVISWAEPASRPSPRLLAAAARFADQAALALAEARRRASEEEARQLHARLEQALIPTIGAHDGIALVAAHYRPGDARLALGGDFYDCVRSPSGALQLIVGDVAGHGPDAAALGASLRAAFRGLALHGAEPAALLHGLEALLLQERSDDEAFATVCVASFDPAGGSAQIVSAGHPPPVVAAPGAPPVVVDLPPVPPLGAPFLRRAAPAAAVRVAEGASLVLYTDGLTEARSAQGRDGRWGIEGLLAAVAAHEPPLGEEALAALVARASSEHGGGLPDDVALLAVTRLPRGA